MGDVTAGELATALEGFRLAVYPDGRDMHDGLPTVTGTVADPDGFAEALHATLGRMAALREDQSRPPKRVSADDLPISVAGWVHTNGTVCDEYLAPPASTPPGGYWCTTHQMHVRHPDSLADPLSSALTRHRAVVAQLANSSGMYEADPEWAETAANLLAAVDAVLAAHRNADGRCAWCRNADGQRQKWPCGEYLAITRALTGEGGND